MNRNDGASRLVYPLLILVCVLGVLVLAMGTFMVLSFDKNPATQKVTVPTDPVKTSGLPQTNADPPILWQPPDSSLIRLSSNADLVLYGKELVVHTARYLGPKGKVTQISNCMNCQNCHLKAGTQPFGNNYAAVASTYPKFRGRSGSVESMEKRINDCIERSLNGQRLKEDSREIRAIMAWFRWVGSAVPKDSVPPGTGLTSLQLLDRAADPIRGKAVYERHCVVCHGREGAGIKHRDSLEWTYPPLAGPNSYNTGAGLFRISRFAGFVKSNMPFGTTYDRPLLSDEEAWDVAAYINSLPRPVVHFHQDWPDIAKKPFDHPFGPYADSFSETRHKYGPFADLLSKQPTAKN